MRRAPRVLAAGASATLARRWRSRWARWRRCDRANCGQAAMGSADIRARTARHWRRRRGLGRTGSRSYTGARSRTVRACASCATANALRLARTGANDALPLLEGRSLREPDRAEPEPSRDTARRARLSARSGTWISATRMATTPMPPAGGRMENQAHGRHARALPALLAAWLATNVSQRRAVCRRRDGRTGQREPTTFTSRDSMLTERWHRDRAGCGNSLPTPGLERATATARRRLVDS
jgi:hypothetical protein